MAQRFRLLPAIALMLLIGTVSALGQTANFTASATSGCAPLVVNFTNTSTGSVTSYSWTFGNGGSSVLSSPSTTYTSPGTYTVTLTVNGSSSKTMTITVYPPPTISFAGNNITGCPPLLTSFTSTVTPNSPGSVTYSWDWGDGTTFGTSANPSHLYTAPGTYTVILKVTNGQGCQTTVTQAALVTVHGKPSPSFTTNITNSCTLPVTVNFTSTSNGFGTLSESWIFGDGGTGTGSLVNHQYNTQGNFTVKLIVTDGNGCTDTATYPSYIHTHQNTATFTGPMDICVSDSTIRLVGFIGNMHSYGPKKFLASFTNTTTGVSGTKWYFGDGSSDTGISVSHAYYTPGTDTVTMVTTVGACYDTVKHIINVHPHPTASISYPPPCPAPTTATFTGPSGTGISNTWIFSSGGSSTGPNVSRTYNSNGYVDTVIIITTNAWGCTDTTDMPVYIHPLYIPMFDSTIMSGCIPVLKKFRSWTNSPICPHFPYVVSPCPVCPCTWAVSTWSWDFGDGSPTSSAASPNHWYTVAGTYTVRCTVVTANGCVLHDSMDVPVDTPVVPSFVASPLTACVHSPVTFISTIVNPPGNTQLIWLYGDGHGNGAADTIYARYDTMGVFSPSLITNHHGCYDTVTRPNYITIVGGTARFKDSAYCPPSKTAAFINKSVGPVTSQVWKFGDGSSDTAYAPVHTYAATGWYRDTLITYSSASGCHDTLADSVHIRPLPAMSFTALDTTICRDDSLYISGTFADSALSFYWVMYGSNTVNRKVLLPVPNSYLIGIPTWMDTSGFYTVTFIVTDTAGCVDSLRKPNYLIVSRPVPRFGATPKIGCTPFPVTFTDSSTYITGTGPNPRAWTFGDGGTATTASQTYTYTYNTPGVYTVKLVATDWNGCADSITKPAYIKARHPVANFSAFITSGCVGKFLQFTNNSTGATTPLACLWDFGDGGTSTSFNPSHTYTAPGSFTIRLIVTDSSGCSDTMTRPGYISITRPVAAFAMSDTLAVCPPLVVHFTGNAINAVGYNWYFGNGNSSVIQNPSASYSGAGAYTVMLVATDAAGCTDTATATARVLGYAGAFTYAPLSGCKPLTVSFSSLVLNAPLLTWDFSDGTTQASAPTSTTHTYLTPGRYVPKLVFTDGAGCSASSTGLDTIKVDGILPGFKALPPCERSTILLVDTSYSFFSQKADWRWRFDNGQTASGASVPHLYPAAGAYPVTLVVTNAQGCKDSITRNITIYPLPVITASPDTVVCVPDAVTISATGGVSYVWSPAATLSCAACTSPAAAPTAPTTYTVAGTDLNGCTNRDSVRIGMQTKTSFTTHASGEICLGEQWALSASGATVYSWSPAASLDSPLSAHPIATPTVTTTYIVTAKEGSCLADTHSVKVTVFPLPTAYAGEDVKMIAGKSTMLQASGQNIHHLVWSPESTLSCSTCYAPEARPRSTTTYVLKTFTDKGCEATDSVRVIVLCDGSQLFIPNTFTPNGDGQNDVFYPRGVGLAGINSMRIFSRWGETVFSRTDMMLNDERGGWDGNYNGRQLNPDTYVYIIEATCDSGAPIRWKGDVTLVR